MMSSHKGWILEAIARESALACSVKINTIFIPDSKASLFKIKDLIKFLWNRKPLENCLFINQNTYFKVLKDSHIIINPQCASVLYTHHSSWRDIDKLEQAKLLSHCSKVYTFNSSDKVQLIKSGVNEAKIKIVYGGVNREIYYPQIAKSDHTYVLITGECKERKSPKLIFDVIDKMPSINFVIHGKGWKQYMSKFKIAQSLNLKIIDFNLKNNPKLMREASVYLSLSKIEGGPYTTIEALASGTPCVVTSTGWNPEIINKSNGVLLPFEPTITQITTAIEQVILLKEKVRYLDLIEGKFTWEQLGRSIYF
jgi:glycosyltransferase involved in cell wall biosynthesis